jgi:peptidoglycan lytic transglycosylase G
MIDELDIPFEDDYERGRHRRRRGGRGAPQARGGRPRRRRGRSLFALFVTLVLLGALAAGGWYGMDRLRGVFTVPDYSGDGDSSVMVHIAPDDSGKDMAGKLYQASVVKSEKAFVNAFNANPQSKSIEVGYYKLRQHMKASKALDALLARKPDHTLTNRVSRVVTITEGEVSLDVFAALAKATSLPVTDFENAAKDPVALGVSADWFTRQDGKPVQKSIEGFLYPATYEFDPGLDATAILKKIVGNFTAEMTKLDFLNQVQNTLHISPFEALVAASIAQVEGRFPNDMAGIARVLYNRAYGGKFPCSCLQLDSTVNYWLRISGQTPKSSKDLTVSDLHNPKDTYNTHDKPGLPIGPISNPGAEALQAAMNPPKNGYLYFVAIDKDGHTAFATTEQEHAANIALAKKNGVL